MRLHTLLPFIFGCLTACQTSTRQPFDVEFYQLTQAEYETARQQFNTFVDSATYAAFEYSDKLSGCDFAPGEYEAACAYYRIRLSQEELAQLKSILKRCHISGAVKNAHEIQQNGDSSTYKEPLFRLYLYDDKQLLATVYPDIHPYIHPYILYYKEPANVNYCWDDELEAALKKLPSYALYAQREAAAQREREEQQRAFENEE